MNSPSSTRRLRVTLSALRRVSPRTLILKLRLADGESLAYQPGQFIGLEAPDGRPRFFSIANAEPVGGELELHVNRAPGGVLTGALFDEAQIGDRFWLTGPFGDFSIPPEASSRTIVVAGGTGFAPIKACLERVAAVRSGRDAFRPLHLYWGARSQEDLYDVAAVGALAGRLPGVRFTPVVDQGHPDLATTRTGHVHRAVIEDFHDLSDYDIYACGAPAMIEALGRDCAAERGFDPARLVSDAFAVGPLTSDLGAPAAAPINIYLDRSIRPCAVAGVVGETLLFSLKRAGLPLKAICGGQGACGTCRVHVAPAWRSRTGRPGRREARLLKYLEAGEGDRLSCQMPLTPGLDGLELHTCLASQGDAP